MKLLRLAIGLFAAMPLFSSAASAAPPYAAGKAHEHRKHHKHHKHPHQYKQPQHRYPPRQQQRRSQGQSQWLWQNQREMHRQPPPRHQHHHHHRPPHRDQLRRDIHRNSHHLRPAPPLPRHMHLVVGRPLPHGWRHPVPQRHARHLPQYPGYEWHSAGRDLVLVAVTSGIVYSILDNVLN